MILSGVWRSIFKINLLMWYDRIRLVKGLLIVVPRRQHRYQKMRVVISSGINCMFSEIEELIHKTLVGDAVFIRPSDKYLKRLTFLEQGI